MVEFFMLVGVSGSSKSTLAHRAQKFLGAKIFSSDEIRKELYGDETDQAHNQKVFQTLHKRIRNCLKSGESCIYDATNLSHKRRKNFLKSISDIKGVKKICFIVATPIEVCIERDKKRDRTVGEEVIQRQVSQFQVPTWDEGWDSITFYTPEDCERKSIWDYFFDEDVPHDCAPYHLERIGEHMYLATKYLMDNYKNYSSSLLMACSFHDIGKFYTKTFYDKKGNLTDRARYYGHENYGAYLYMTSKEFKDLMDSKREDEAYQVLYLIALHMELYKDKSSVFESLPDEMKKTLTILYECDRAGRQKGEK